MKGFKELTPLSEAINSLLKLLTHRIRDVEVVEISDAPGRVCGENVYAPIDSPAYDRSAVDGYAVIAEDTFGAAPTNPIELKLIGRIDAGYNPLKLPALKPGHAIEIMTGAAMPPGSNAVVPAEHAEKKGEIVEVYSQVHPYQNISRRGEDYSRGELVLEKGQIVKPWHIGALASLGLHELKVVRKARVAILSTGGELIELGQPLKPGKIYNSTKPMLKALLSVYGAEPIDLGLVGDDLDLIKKKVSEGLDNADAIIVTGGTSIGERDLVPEAVSDLSDFMIHGLAIRPGKPTGFAISSGKPIFMLSGFPVAALIGFRVLVIPALERMLGCRFDPPPRVRGRLTRRIASPPGIRTYARVRIYGEDDEILVEPLRVTGSGILSTLTRGNGLLVIPENVEGYDEGEEVEVEILQPIHAGGEYQG